MVIVTLKVTSGEGQLPTSCNSVNKENTVRTIHTSIPRHNVIAFLLKSIKESSLAPPRKHHKFWIRFQPSYFTSHTFNQVHQE